MRDSSGSFRLRRFELRARLRRRDQELNHIQPEELRGTRQRVRGAREDDIGVASGQYNFPPDELLYIDRHYIVLDHTPW